MGPRRSQSPARQGESGGVLVLFACFMAVAVLLMSFTIDIGNWFEHQRHLQTQAAAAALAAAGKVTLPCTPTVESEIYATAAKYGGANSVSTPGGSASATTPLYNEQIGGTPQSKIHELINSKKYFGQSRGDTTTVEKAPCDPEASMVDVKMTETSLPWIFKALNVPDINAHARVSIVAENFATAVLPLIESEPREARVFFVNDNPDGSTSNYADELLGTGLLTNIGTNEEKNTIKWSDSTAPVKVNITAAHIGVRIALAGKVGALQGAGNEGVEVCRHEYVECFDEDVGVVPPLLHIAGYSLEGEGKGAPFEPVSHKVWLTKAAGDTCTSAYFDNAFGPEKKSTCSLHINAMLQYGKGNDANTKGITVTPEFVFTEGFSNRKEAVKQPALKLEGGVWTGVGNLPNWFYGNFGSTEMNLVVACKAETGSPCAAGKGTETKTLKDVQRAYSSGPDGSNRIVAAKVFEPGAEKPVPGETDADAFEICETANAKKCEHKLAVTIELKGSLEPARKFFNKEGEPMQPFHIVQGDNDQEYDDQFVVSCPPTTNPANIVEIYKESLARGCPGKYSVNKKGGTCTAETEANKKIETEEAGYKKAAEEEVKAREKREATEKAERTTWEKEEKETKITKAQREAKEKAQSETATKVANEEAAAKAKWEKEEKETKITKAEAEAKAKVLEAAAAKITTEEKTARNQWKKEEAEGKLTKAAREEKEAKQSDERAARVEREIAERAKWESESTTPKVTKKEREEKEAIQNAEKTARVTREIAERTQWLAEEKEPKVSKAQKAEKEAAQKVSREKAEQAEAKAREKREIEEATTKKSKEQIEGSAHECVGLVSVQEHWSSNEARDAEEFTNLIRSGLLKRIERPVNGLHYYCPSNWQNNNKGGVPIIPANDSRLVQFFVIPFTVTDFLRKNAVSPLVPINEFATFYVTGFPGDECKSDDALEQPRELVGHLIKYVNVLGEAGGTTACKLDSLETCEAVLTE